MSTSKEGFCTQGDLHPGGLYQEGVCIQQGDLHQGGSAWGEGWGLHPGGLHLRVEGSASKGVGRTPSPHPRDRWDTTGYGQQAGGMHPTGIYSC